MGMNLNKENQIKDYEVISEIMEDYLRNSEKGLNFHKITDGVLKLSEGKFAVFNLYEEDGEQFTTMAVSGENKLIKKAMDFLRIDVEGKKWNHDSIRAEKIKHEVITRFS
ncbi:MAG: hypothetical protein SCJ93_14435, partial [Bacillota bacterium]|nr:hypothetical protein [Bacillota bacterium]